MGPKQLEKHARVVLHARAAELRQVEEELSDLAALLPEPAMVPAADGAGEGLELASVHDVPPSVLEAMLGAVELATEQVTAALRLLSEASELRREALIRRWLAQRGEERRQGLARRCLKAFLRRPTGEGS